MAIAFDLIFKKGKKKSKTIIEILNYGSKGL